MHTTDWFVKCQRIVDAKPESAETVFREALRSEVADVRAIAASQLGYLATRISKRAALDLADDAARDVSPEVRSHVARIRQYILDC